MDKKDCKNCKEMQKVIDEQKAVILELVEKYRKASKEIERMRVEFAELKEKINRLLNKIQD